MLRKRNEIPEGNSFSARKRNVESMAAIEADERLNRTFGERVGDFIVAAAGQLWFFSMHAIWFCGWIVLNLGFIKGLKPFDPYPFSFLTFVVSLEAIFLSLFILISQGRETRQADQRAKLDLQINLLAENETTKLLQMMQELCKAHKLAIADDPELSEMTAVTSPQHLMEEVRNASNSAAGS